MICSKPGCRAHRIRNSDFCYWHTDPENAKIAGSKGGKGKSLLPADMVSKLEPVSDGADISSITGIQGIVSGLVAALMMPSEQDITIRAKCIGYLLSIGLKCVELGSFENRLNELEKRLDGIAPGQ